MRKPQQLTLWQAALLLSVSPSSPAFCAEQDEPREAIGSVKLEISVRYAEGAPGPRTASWWSAIDSTFVYWFQNQGQEQAYDYQLAAYESALPYAKSKHQWRRIRQGLEDWGNDKGQKPSGYTPGAPISRVKITVWDEEGNEHLLVTNEGGWATMCGKIREAYDIGVHSREIQLAGRNAVIAGVAFEDLILTERGLTLEIIVPPDASAPAVHIQEGAGLCCGTGVFYEGDGQSRQRRPQKTHTQMAASSNNSQTTNAEEGMFKLSFRLVHEEGTIAPGVKATNWWSNFEPSFLYWFGDRQSDYRFAAFDQSFPYLKANHHWQGIDEMNGNDNRPPDRNPGAPIPKVEVSVWGLGRERTRPRHR